MSRFVRATIVVLFFCPAILAQTAVRQNTISILDFGKSPIAVRLADQVRATFRSSTEFLVADADLSRSAAQGIGYAGSLNLPVTNARDLGVALATDFYILGDAQTLRRNSSEAPVYYESYCTIFLVSSRTGRLITWVRETEKGSTPQLAEQELEHRIANPEFFYRLRLAVRRAVEDEAIQRAVVPGANAPLIEAAPDDADSVAANGLQLPRPYRRFRPDYPETAAVADVEATVDVMVDVGSDGEVGQVEIARWAGFGLDESAMATVRKLHFYPAMRDGSAVPLRVLLRYNFRKPSN